ncbi:MAG: undecaprenyl diphosphate synthase family protein [Nanoarchaeota archaeon]|nr:undecaprenyl diphosphate synthase family protein [Nanoarchaeota archaeon]
MLNHIGFIMDGNRRYSKRNNLEYKDGYKLGMLQFFNILKWQVTTDIQTTSFFALSLDNSKKRASKELETIKDLIITLLEDPQFEEFCIENGVFVQMRGRYFIDNRINTQLVELDRTKEEKNLNSISKNLILKKADKELSTLGFESENDLLQSVEKKIIEFEEKLFKKFEKPKYYVNIALFYDGVDEIITTTQRIAKKVKEEDLNIEEINSELFVQESYFSNTPPPQVIVRTGDAPRISGFMLFLSAYSELYLTKKLWPELNVEDLNKIINWFTSIQRNFGK